MSLSLRLFGVLLGVCVNSSGRPCHRQDTRSSDSLCLDSPCWWKIGNLTPYITYSKLVNYSYWRQNVFREIEE
ncbi:hypothetical protein LguiB_001760 [Lonicera macranthoides]